MSDMINLDIDLSYFTRYYHIDKSAIKEYQNMSITQIMQAEAEKGNARAAEFLMHILSDPKELAKVFRLIEPKNRFLILSHMNSDDLMMIMGFLEPKELILGLSIFNPEALVELMKNLPPETLATLVLKNMDAEKFLKILPEKFMDEFLKSDKLDRDMLTKAMKDVDEVQLQKMMENATGESCYDDKKTILGKMEQLDDRKFQKAILSFEKEGKEQLIGSLLQEKPELFEEFSAEAMVQPFMMMEKSDILQSLMVLETEELLPMLEDLPQEVMALIATQIDPEKFAEILSSDFSDIIASCGIAA